MKNRPIHIIFILAFVLSLGACETDAYRQVSLNTGFLSLKPKENQSSRFANANGDTTLVELSQNSQAFLPINSSFNVGSFAQDIKVEGENRNYTLSCAQPEISIKYQFDIVANAADERGFSDRLSLYLQDSTGNLADQIILLYQNDSLNLASPTSYRDSLSLISKTFTQVLSPIISNGTENRSFYYSLNKGLVGFQTKEGVLYELID